MDDRIKDFMKLVETVEETRKVNNFQEKVSPSSMVAGESIPVPALEYTTAFDNVIEMAHYAYLRKNRYSVKLTGDENA